MRLHPTRWLACVFLAGNLTVAAGGCQSAAPPVAAPGVIAASHGGTLKELPKKAGYAEIMVEPEKGTRAKGRLVIYFVNADGSGPPSPVPSDVTFADESGKPFPLVARNDSSFKGATFESAPGPFVPGRELLGELSLSLGGEAVKLPLAVR